MSSHRAEEKSRFNVKEALWVTLGLLVIMSSVMYMGWIISKKSYQATLEPVNIQNSQPSISLTPLTPITSSPISDRQFFDNGTFVMGVDKDPGVYRTPGPLSGLARCSITVLQGDVIVGGQTTEHIPTRISLKNGLTARSVGCKTWQRIGDA